TELEFQHVVDRAGERDAVLRLDGLPQFRQLELGAGTVPATVEPAPAPVDLGARTDVGGIAQPQPQPVRLRRLQVYLDRHLPPDRPVREGPHPYRLEILALQQRAI